MVIKFGSIKLVKSNKKIQKIQKFSLCCVHPRISINQSFKKPIRTNFFQGPWYFSLPSKITTEPTNLFALKISSSSSTPHVSTFNFFAIHFAIKCCDLLIYPSTVELSKYFKPNWLNAKAAVFMRLLFTSIIASWRSFSSSTSSCFGNLWFYWWV